MRGLSRNSASTWQSAKADRRQRGGKVGAAPASRGSNEGPGRTPLPQPFSSEPRRQGRGWRGGERQRQPRTPTCVLASPMYTSFRRDSSHSTCGSQHVSVRSELAGCMRSDLKQGVQGACVAVQSEFLAGKPAAAGVVHPFRKCTQAHLLDHVGRQEDLVQGLADAVPAGRGCTRLGKWVIGVRAHAPDQAHCCAWGPGKGS